MERIILKIGDREIVVPEQMSRIMYCQECARQGRPSLENQIALFCGSRKQERLFDVKELSAEGESGFTPHLITGIELLAKEGKPYFSFMATCGVAGCGHETLYRKKRQGGLGFDFKREVIWTTHTEMPLKRFIGLLQYKQPEIYLDLGGSIHITEPLKF